MNIITAGTIVFAACAGAGAGFIVAAVHTMRVHPVLLAVLDVIVCSAGLFQAVFAAWLLLPKSGTACAAWAFAAAVAGFALALFILSRRTFTRDGF